MGNVMDRKVSCSEARVTTSHDVATSTHPQLALKEPEKLVAAESKEEPKPQINSNLTFQLYTYRQQMGCKKHQVMKWATSKLLLTEELLKLHRQTTSESWTDYEISDDDDEEDFEDVENQVPKRDNNDNDDLLAQELCNLKNYRLTLRGTILEVAQEKMKKREKKKLKRLKRRTLISSKKPSNKDKHKLWHYPAPSMPPLEDEEEEQQHVQPEVIVID